MTNIDNIKSLDWQIKLGKIGEVVEYTDDINQCINTILTTIKGTDPHRPEFGSEIYKYIDYPIKDAVPNIIREAIDAIAIWEPRVEIKNIKADIDISTIRIRMTYMVKSTGDTVQTEVTI